MSDSNNQKQTLPGPIALLHESIDLIQKRFKIYFTIAAIPYIFYVAMSIRGPLYYLFYLLYLFAFFLGDLAFLYTIKNREKTVDVKEALIYALKRFFPFMWLYILTVAMTIGGFMLFILPGIFLAYSFIFGRYIFVFEGEKGMTALLKSKEYTRGYFWPIFGRMLVLGGVSIVLGSITFILTFIFQKSSLSIVGSLIITFMNVLAFLLYLFYPYLLYEHLKKINPVKTLPSKTPYLLLALWGVIGPMIAIAVIGSFAAVLLVSLNPQEKMLKARDAQRMEDRKDLQSSLKAYKDEKGFYPQTLDKLVPDYLPGVPIDPSLKTSYLYVLGADGDYQLCIVYEQRERECVTPTTGSEVVYLDANDPRVLKAKADAQKEMNSFITSLAKNSSNPNYAHSIKTDFIEGKTHEHMWVSVTAYKEGIFYGHLNNISEFIKSLKDNDPVEVKRENVEDWIIRDLKTNTTTGGFSVSALQNK